MARLSFSTGLPEIIRRKIYKTGQTRGAENDEIYQNRVSRDSTVLIPLSVWHNVRNNMPEGRFTNGYIVFAYPHEYFDQNKKRKATLDSTLQLGVNLLIFYRTRDEWKTYTPKDFGWSYATSRQAPLGGEYIARVPDTTSEADTQIFHGFTGSETGGKGAGIRFFEYASSTTLERTRYQLSYLIWHTVGIDELCEAYNCAYIEESKQHVVEYCKNNNLSDHARLEHARVMKSKLSTCPFCLEAIFAPDFCMKLDQTEGRETRDLTVTKINLFHVEELRLGIYNHREYNLGWGHHHCNTVVADMGIQGALDWLAELMRRNGYSVDKSV